MEEACRVEWPVFLSGSNSFRHKHEPQVGHFGVAEEAFGQVDFEVMVFKSLENVLENLKMMFVGSRVDDDVVNVDNDVLDRVKHLLH